MWLKIENHYICHRQRTSCSQEHHTSGTSCISSKIQYNEFIAHMLQSSTGSFHPSWLQLREEGLIMRAVFLMKNGERSIFCWICPESKLSDMPWECSCDEGIQHSPSLWSQTFNNTCQMCSKATSGDIWGYENYFGSSKEYLHEKMAENESITHVSYKVVKNLVERGKPFTCNYVLRSIE